MVKLDKKSISTNGFLISESVLIMNQSGIKVAVVVAVAVLVMAGLEYFGFGRFLVAVLIAVLVAVAVGFYTGFGLLRVVVLG